jgi:hypothetical protein
MITQGVEREREREKETGREHWKKEMNENYFRDYSEKSFSVGLWLSNSSVEITTQKL